MQIWLGTTGRNFNLFFDIFLVHGVIVHSHIRNIHRKFLYFPCMVLEPSAGGHTTAAILSCWGLAIVRSTSDLRVTEIRDHWFEGNHQIYCNPRLNWSSVVWTAAAEGKKTSQNHDSAPNGISVCLNWRLLMIFNCPEGAITVMTRSRGDCRSRGRSPIQNDCIQIDFSIISLAVSCRQMACPCWTELINKLRWATPLGWNIWTILTR